GRSARRRSGPPVQDRRRRFTVTYPVSRADTHRFALTRGRRRRLHRVDVAVSWAVQSAAVRSGEDRSPNSHTPPPLSQRAHVAKEERLVMTHVRTRSLVTLVLVTVLSSLLAGPIAAAPPPGKGAPIAGKAVLFVSDGMRQDLVQQYAAAGLMPTMAGFL